MAPNLKRISLLSYSLADVRVVRPKDTLYQSRPTEDSDSYWEWKAPVDLFSADHLTGNLIKSARAVTESDTNPSSDAYWAEDSTSSASEDEVDPVSYWAEPSHAHTEADSYWAEAAPVHYHHHEDGEVSEDYWNEATHTKLASDCYWAEGERSSANYWRWNAGELTSHDRYWCM